MDTSTYNERMELALSDLKQQTKANVFATAKKYQVTHTTLRNRWKGKSLSMKEASSAYKQRLNNDQEEVLVERINLLTNQHVLPTSAIVKNLAEEILQGSVGKNWITNFIKRNQPRLINIYLQNIDSQWTKSEYESLYQAFYTLI